MDDPVVSRSTRVTPVSSSFNSTSSSPSSSPPLIPTSPVPLPVSPSSTNTLSRIWDRFSPPSIPSPFSHFPQSLPTASTFLSSSSRGSLPTPDASPIRPHESHGGGTSMSARMRPPRLEQHDSASQLSFSLRRASTNERAVDDQSTARDRREGSRNRSLSGRAWSGSGFGGGGDERWESPFKLPNMSRWRGKGKEVAVMDDDDEDDGMHVRNGVDDEACFVDEVQGKVDFIVSLPSEISLYILLHLDHHSLLACSIVSRQWRHFALDPLIWRDLFHQNERWRIKPEAYRAAALAAQRSQHLAGATPTPSTAHLGSGGATASYFDSQPHHRKPGSIPNLRRAASSFGKAGVKKVSAGADRVSQGSATLGRKLSGMVNDFGNISISGSGGSGANSPGGAGGSVNRSRSTSRAPSEAGGESSTANTSSTDPPSTPRGGLMNRRTTATALLTLSTPLAPSTSTLSSTHAFASPPSTTLSRTNSSTAIASLASSISALPPATNLSPSPSIRRLPQTPSAVATPSHHTLLALPSPAISLSLSMSQSSFAPEAPLFLDWPKLYRDRSILEKRWNAGKPSWNWLEGHEDSVYCVQFDETKVISGSRDKTIKIWDLTSGTINRTLHGHEGSILCLQYDSTILVSGSSDSRILVWDLVGEEGTGKGKYEIKLQLVGHAMGVLDLCFDERWIVSCSKDTTTRVWNRHTGEFFRSLSGHRGPVNAVALHSNRVLTASGDALMKMWDIETGKTLRTFSGHTRGLACLQWSPSGKEIVSGGNDQVIKLWNAETGECTREFRGHTDLVRSLSFDQFSRRIVSVSYDKTTRVWDADGNGEEEGQRDTTNAAGGATTTRTSTAKHRFKSHSSLVFDVAFDVSRIVSSSHDRRILVMDYGAGLDVSKFAS